MAVRTSVNLARFRNTLGAWLVGEFGSTVQVRWADQDYGRPKLPFVVLQIIGGPRKVGTQDSRLFRKVPTSIQVTFANAATGRDYVLFVNRTRLELQAPSADNDALRDAFLAALPPAVSDFPEPVTATSLGAGGALRVDQVALGDLRKVEGFRASDVTVATLTTAPARETVGQRRIRVQFDVFAASSVRSPTADEIAATIHSSLFERETIDLLTADGIGPIPPPEEPRDLSSVKGSEVEQRLQFDVSFHAPSRLTRAHVGAIVGVELQNKTTGRVFEVP